jgi:ergothioneine biosynthesis protein EgtB
LVAASRDALIRRYHDVRYRTEALSAPLSAEDQLLQSMPDCSPVKWHRAHTTWFFETFVLGPSGRPPFDARFHFLFNSYYEALGPRHPRPERGLLSRPSVDEISEYRRVVDDAVVRLLRSLDDGSWPAALRMIELGLAHEEQHQELLLTDLLHAFSNNPLRPAYRSSQATPTSPATSATPVTSISSILPSAIRFVPFEGAVVEIGADSGFHFDHEGPRHRCLMSPFALSHRLVTVAELKAFIADEGYRTPSLWLSEGWNFVQRERLSSPLYSAVEGGALLVFGLDGQREAGDDEPVAHLTFYEADALARYLEARLPTEAEWEMAASEQKVDGHFLSLTGPLRPLPACGDGEFPRQLYGDLWEWTRSAFEPYPGYRPATGALGEYNGKFMVNQLVLRGGSYLTPPGHLRPSYRNFWPPDTRFQATGLRLARDIR